MLLRCIRPFGHFEPGDELPVSDDIEVFDHTYFEVVPAEDAGDESTSNEESE